MSMPNAVHPFAAPVPPPASRRGGIAASGPPVDPAEVETAQRAAEVVLMWGDEVLHVAHVSPPRDVVIGEAGGGVVPDYLVGRELLGAERLPIVVERGGRLHCVIPEGASGEVRAGGQAKSIAALEREGELLPFADVPGARLYALPEGAAARIEHRGLSFLVRSTAAARAVGTGPGWKLRHAGWIGLSLAVHAAFLVMFYFVPPRTSALSLDTGEPPRRMIAYLQTTAAREEPPPEWTVPSPEPAGGTGERHALEEGAMGDPDARPSRGRYGVQGDPRDRSPELAREHARENMETIGAIGALRAMLGSWEAPTSPYGADAAHGNDPESAMGALMGDAIASNFGAGGLGMRGTGRGAGGFGIGTIGLDRLGTLGRGGGCRGERCGEGDGPGGYGSSIAWTRERRERVPEIHPGQAAVMGGLSPEAIRRVVRRHINEVRFCYEQGLQRNPSLEGRVTVRWIIDGTGRVQAAALASSSVSNEPVEACIVNAVRRWTFPAPEGGGAVGVSYPFLLQSSH